MDFFGFTVYFMCGLLQMIVNETYSIRTHHGYSNTYRGFLLSRDSTKTLIFTCP